MIRSVLLGQLQLLARWASGQPIEIAGLEAFLERVVLPVLTVCGIAEHQFARLRLNVLRILRPSKPLANAIDGRRGAGRGSIQVLSIPGPLARIAVAVGGVDASFAAARVILGGTMRRAVSPFLTGGELSSACSSTCGRRGVVSTDWSLATRSRRPRRALGRPPGLWRSLTRRSLAFHLAIVGGRGGLAAGSACRLVVLRRPFRVVGLARPGGSRNDRRHNRCTKANPAPPIPRLIFHGWLPQQTDDVTDARTVLLQPSCRLAGRADAVSLRTRLQAAKDAEHGPETRSSVPPSPFSITGLHAFPATPRAYS